MLFLCVQDCFKGVSEEIQGSLGGTKWLKMAFSGVSERIQEVLRAFHEVSEAFQEEFFKVIQGV